MAVANGVARGRARRLVPALVLLVAGLVGCGGSEPERASWPDGLSVFVIQSWLAYDSRTAFVRLIDESEREVTVTRAEISSPRFEEVVWTGETTFQDAADLEFELPRGGCSGAVDVRVTLTYSIDDGPTRVSRTSAEDRYRAIENVLVRDCAEETLREAADLRVGESRVTGSGRESVLEVPVTLAPTGGRDDVTFRGFEDTVIFRQVAGSASVESGTSIRLRGDPVTVRLRLQPSRCDIHALAEGTRGTFIPTTVQAPEIESGERFFLPLGEERRGGLMEFFASHCGL